MEQITYLLKLFGGGFEHLNLLLFVGFFCILCAQISPKIPRFLLALLGSFIVTLQLCALYFTKKFIGYAFYLHFNTRDILEMSSVYSRHLIALVAFFVLLAFFIFFTKNIVIRLFDKMNVSTNFLSKNKRFLTIAFFSTSLIVWCLSGGMLRSSLDLFTLLNTPTDSENFEANLQAIGINDYVLPQDLQVEKGKNIIVISLESYERGFLSDKYAHLTPNLCSLKKAWTYHDVQQNAGSGWTSGSLYTYLTGLPAYFGIEGNFIFQTAYHSDISSVGHILKKGGYETSFLSENARFAGTQDMLNALQIDEIIDKTILRHQTRDKDLLAKAKEKIKSYKADNQHFGLFISTLDTHFPNGIYDQRMEKFVPKRASSLEFMVSAVDYLLGDFVAFLEAENMLENTAVFIFPDHLKMGDGTMFDDTGERGLFVITNSQSTPKTEKKLHQIDLPNLILNGAEVRHNARFLTEYIEGNTNDFILKHIKELTKINTSGLLRMRDEQYILPVQSPHYEEYKQDTSRFIAHAGGMIEGKIYTNSLEALDLNYAKGFRRFELDILTTSDSNYVAVHNWEEWAAMTNYTGMLPPNIDTFLQQKIYGKYTPLNLPRINEWFAEYQDAILVTDKVNEPKKFVPLFVDKQRLMMELFDNQSIKEAAEENILSAMAAQKVVESLGKNPVQELKVLGAKHIVVTRKFIAPHLNLIEKLKQNDIETYAYRVNTYTGKDEDYIVKYEMDKIYGIYADEWSFAVRDSLK